jgi:hypothetical protein
METEWKMKVCVEHKFADVQTQEASLTEHLMREQSRIHQQLTEAAVREAHAC